MNARNFEHLGALSHRQGFIGKLVSNASFLFCKSETYRRMSVPNYVYHGPGKIRLELDCNSLCNLELDCQVQNYIYF